MSVGPFSAAAAAAASASLATPTAEPELDEYHKHKLLDVNFNITYTIAQDLLFNDESRVKDATHVTESGGVALYLREYLEHYMQEIEMLLKRCEVLRENKREIQMFIEAFDRTLSNIVKTIDSHTSPMILPWWEETFVVNNGFTGELYPTSDFILFAALASGCPLTAARLDKGTLFNSKKPEEVYGLWVLNRDKKMKKFVKNMPSFKALTQGATVESHWHCARCNNWSGAQAAYLLRGTGHQLISTGATMDYCTKLHIEDIERVVCTRDAALMNAVIDKVKRFYQWNRYFIGDNFGVCCFFKSICGCISMSVQPHHPYLSADVSMDPVFDVLLGAIVKICPDLITDTKYAYSIVLAAAHARRYDYATKILDVIHGNNSASYLGILLLAMETARDDVVELSPEDVSIAFICRIVSTNPVLEDFLREEDDQNVIIQYVLATINKPVP